MLNEIKKQPLSGFVRAILPLALVCVPFATCQSPNSARQPTQEPKKLHTGVLVAGHGTGAFESIFIEVFDMLGERRVEVANYGLQKVDRQRVIGFTPLPELIDMLPEIGASSLLYIKVKPGATDRAATVYFQCFDSNGHILWEDKANDVLVDGGNTIFHPNGWKKKLALHIGGPGLLVKQ